MNDSAQQWNVQNYQKFASFVPQLGQPLLDLLQPRPKELVLDLGCGDGALTEKLVQAGCEVVGVDASFEMVKAAKARGINAYVMDARELIFSEEFDAVFSNAVLHWVKEPHLAVAGIAKALKPGGRFVAEFGGKGNIKTIEDALIKVVGFFGVDGRKLSPWYYPAPEEYQAMLEKHGLQVESIALILRPTPLPEGMMGWLKTFASPFLVPFPSMFHHYILWHAKLRMKPILCDKDGNWHADYVRLRVSARKSQEK
jgi:trans-aconitate methyltransferase